MTAKTPHVRVLTIASLTRLDNTPSGNPRWQVRFTDGTEASTWPDADAAIGLGNSEYRDTPLLVTFTPASGQITHVRVPNRFYRVHVHDYNKGQDHGRWLAQADFPARPSREDLPALMPLLARPGRYEVHVNIVYVDGTEVGGWQWLQGSVPDKAVAQRLGEIRVALRSENISYGELAELQSLASSIDPGDTELLEAAGVPEFPAETE